MTDPSRTALVIAHEPDGPAGQIGIRLRQRGFDLHTHLLTDDYDDPQSHTPWPDFAGFDLIVAMGSVRSLTRKHEISTWIDAELDAIRHTVDADRPFLGVCFGGQLLAEAMGGSVEPSPVVEIGWFDLTALGDAPDVIEAGSWFQWHHDRFHAPPGAEVLAQNETSTQLIRIRRAVGTQFHPEVDIPHIEGFLRDAPDDYLAEFGVDPDRMRAEMRDLEAANASRCHALVDWFLDTVAFPAA